LSDSLQYVYYNSYFYPIPNMKDYIVLQFGIIDVIRNIDY
jgi:hypothetical protein